MAGASNTPQAAWSVSVELLSASGAPESASPLQYFSANTLYTKVRKHWHQLEAEHRDQLGGVILQVRDLNRRFIVAFRTGYLQVLNRLFVTVI